MISTIYLKIIKLTEFKLMHQIWLSFIFKVLVLKFSKLKVLLLISSNNSNIKF